MPELQLADRQRSPGKGSCSDLAPVQILFTLCARTCHRWNKAVRSPQVLKMLSIVRFPLPAASAHAGKSSAEAAARAVAAGGQKGAMASMMEQAGADLLDPRVENILRVASRAGNDAAQFLFGLYLSRQKTFALLCLACPATGSPAAEADGEDPAAAVVERRRTQERMREAVLDTFDEGVELLRSAGDLMHPNALYQLGMLAFGSTDVKLRSRLFGHDGSGVCGDCVLGEEHADLYWRRAAELGHLESRLIVDADFRLNHLQELEERMLAVEAERLSWRLCAGNRLLTTAKRPQSSSTKARECSHEECGMYTLLCEFKQCAGCATSHKKQR
jgi:TPR repeat protein